MDQQRIEDLWMPVTYCWHLAREFPPEPLLEGTGLTLADLEGPVDRIRVSQLLTYSRNAIALGAARPDWHLGWAGRLADHFHGPISVAMMSAPTLGAGLDAFLRYFPSRIPYMHMQGRIEGDRFAAELRPLIDLGVALPLLIETPLVILHSYVRTVAGVDMKAAALELAYKPPAHRALYGRYFDGPVRFDQSRYALVIPAAWRDLPNPGRMEVAWRHALRQCDQTRACAVERDTLGAVLSYLHGASEADRRRRAAPTLEEVAEALHISPRTLIRRLRRIGTTYQRVVDEFLKARACELLANERLRVKEVAAALGFDNPANFGKAFKRWCGTTPGGYRAGLAAEDGAREGRGG